MPKKESTLVNSLLFALYAAGEVLSLVMSPYEWRRRALYGSTFSSYKSNIYQLKRRGLINFVQKDGKKFLKLTKKGELEILLAKAKIPATGKWDGKWRIVIFDIPEKTKLERNQLRGLLKKNGFRKLQASVYVSPLPLNREAIKYLGETGLNNFIRIMKVEEMDNDKDLKKKFNLR